MCPISTKLQANQCKILLVESSVMKIESLTKVENPVILKGLKLGGASAIKSSA